MTKTAERLRDEVIGLTPKERAEMAYLLIESLDSEVDPGSEAAWDAELVRRAHEIRSGVSQAEDSESVFKRVRASLT